ncbi:transcriptional activator protein Pur-beta [Clonorchis sinensis]|uniref:Transcriptional activator protein Pur-beta n=1 Tax=Clonorchis sinensis TaxID=79923 RepID=G7YKQ5_CLOSI|nr:transcriptional activator protein Pur-beta [Clonorchis sinensis]
MRRTLKSLQNPGVQIACDEDLVDLDYADDIVLVFVGENRALEFLDEEQVIPSFGMHFAPTKYGHQAEQELATRTLRIQNKRFYLDVKQNRRGRFVKITEAGSGGQKSRILMSIAVALEMQEKVSKLSDIYSQLPSHNPQCLAQDGRLASDTIVRDSRRYYLDLKENERGRFLRLAMLTMGVRDQIAIPAQGMIELRNALADLTHEYAGDVENDAFSDLPESKVLFVGNKTFYFDVGSNRYGVYLRISEVRANVRSSVTIPEQHCGRFRDIISELSAKMSEQKVSNGCPPMNGDNEEKVPVAKLAEKPKAVADAPAASEPIAVA